MPFDRFNVCPKENQLTKTRVHIACLHFVGGPDWWQACRHFVRVVSCYLAGWFGQVRTTISRAVRFLYSTVKSLLPSFHGKCGTGWIPITSVILLMPGRPEHLPVTYAPSLTFSLHCRYWLRLALNTSYKACPTSRLLWLSFFYCLSLLLCF